MMSVDDEVLVPDTVEKDGRQDNAAIVNESQRANRKRPMCSLDLFKLLEPSLHQTYLGG